MAFLLVQAESRPTARLGLEKPLLTRPSSEPVSLGNA